MCSQILGIKIDMLLMLGADILAEQKRHAAFEHRCTVGMGRVESKPLVGNDLSGSGKALDHFGANRCRHAAVVHTDNNRRRVIPPLQDQRIGVETLRDFFKLLGAAAVATQTDWILGRDINIRSASRPRASVLRHHWQLSEQEYQEDDPLHLRIMRKCNKSLQG